MTIQQLRFLIGGYLFMMPCAYRGWWFVRPMGLKKVLLTSYYRWLARAFIKAVTVDDSGIVAHHFVSTVLSPSGTVQSAEMIHRGACNSRAGLGHGRVKADGRILPLSNIICLHLRRSFQHCQEKFTITKNAAHYYCIMLFSLSESR